MKAAFMIVILAVLAACSTLSGNAAERRVVYACNYGPGLTVNYAGSAATIESVDGTVTLRQRPSGSGFWYESATHSLQGKGDEITYKVRQMSPRLCRAAR